ncbi:MAG: hypothetical protein ACSLFQ_01520 [Thermoanaerobaculia bacterium]
MATERDIRLGLRVEGLDKTKQDFKVLGESVKALGPEGAAAADAIVSGFKQIEDSSDKTAGKIADGRKVSQAELDKLIIKYDELKSTIEESFPEGAPAELIDALTKTEDRIGATIRAADEIPGSLARARDSFRQLGQAAEAAKDPLDALPAGVVQGFKAARAAVDEFEQKFQESGDVGTGELERIIKSQERLKIAIERSGVSLDDLGPDARRAFDVIQVQADEATKTVQRLESAVDRNKVAVKDLSTGWSSLGDAVTQSMGRHADVAVQAGIVAAALNSIKDAIEATEKQMGLAQLGGATLSETFIEMKGNFADFAVVAQKAADDVAAAGIVFASQAPTLERAKSFVDDYLMSLNKIGVAALAGKEGMAAYQVALDANLEPQERLTLAHQHAAEVLEFQRLAMEKGAEGHKVWQTVLKASGGTAEGFIASMKSMEGALALAKVGTDDVEKANRAADDSYAAITKSIREATKATDEHIASLAEEVAAQQKMNFGFDGMTESIKKNIDWLAYAIPMADSITKSWDANTEALQRNLDGASGLSKAERERIQTLIDLAKNIENMDAQQRAALKTALESALAMDQAGASLIRFTESAESGRTKISNATAEMERNISGFIRFSKAADQASDSLDGMTSRADKAAEVLRRLDESSDQAAGTTAAPAPEGAAR